MVNQKTRIFALALIVALFLCGCSSSSDRNPPKRANAPAPANIEQAMALAKAEANVHPDIDFRVEHVTNSDLYHSLFQEYYFLYIWGPMGHTQSSPFAIAPDGIAFKLPDDFNSMANHANLSVKSSQEALSLLKFYLQFHTIWPGTDYQKIIGKLTDIPGIDNHDEETESSLPNVSPLNITSNRMGWSIEFYTWQAINGVLYKWNLSISQNGTIRTEHTTRIGEKVGNFLSIE